MWYCLILHRLDAFAHIFYQVVLCKLKHRYFAKAKSGVVQSCSNNQENFDTPSKILFYIKGFTGGIIDSFLYCGMVVTYNLIPGMSYCRIK